MLCRSADVRAPTSPLSGLTGRDILSPAALALFAPLSRPRHLPARPPATPDVYLPSLDCDKALLARLQLTEKLAAGSEAYVQVRAHGWCTRGVS